jgi:hypothetical protein
VNVSYLHEFADPFDVFVRELGEGSARVMIWGSVNANPQFLVRLYGSGKVVVVDMTDLRVAGNPGDPRDGLPGWEIPTLWRPLPELEL